MCHLKELENYNPKVLFCRRQYFIFDDGNFSKFIEKLTKRWRLAFRKTWIVIKYGKPCFFAVLKRMLKRTFFIRHPWIMDTIIARTYTLHQTNEVPSSVCGTLGLHNLKVLPYCPKNDGVLHWEKVTLMYRLPICILRLQPLKVALTFSLILWKVCINESMNDRGQVRWWNYLSCTFFVYSLFK